MGECCGPYEVSILILSSGFGKYKLAAYAGMWSMRIVNTENNEPNFSLSSGAVTKLSYLICFWHISHTHTHTNVFRNGCALVLFHHLPFN